MTLRERFNNKYTFSVSGCWVWHGAVKASDGYGLIWVSGKHERAHRVAWILFRGPIPEGLLVCHRCDNPLCVNPDHLFLGNHHDNLADMGKKGRQRLQKNRDAARGQNNNASKLTLRQVREIKRLISTGRDQSSIAREFSVTAGAINKIAVGKNWSHVEGGER